MFLNKLLSLNFLHVKHVSTKTITPATSQIFFKPEVQQLLLNLTRVEVDKVFRKRKHGQELKPPEYKFLTTEEVNMLKEKAYAKAVKKVQIPPVVPPRDDSKVEILSEDKEIIGHDISKFVFTDITFGVSNAQRLIVVREPSGVLREANTSERHRMNWAYFPRSGGSYKHPEMFDEENLLSLCNRKEYVFILDRACAHFEPDDHRYHTVLGVTFTHLNESNAFELLRSTRHFGSLAFFLAHNKCIDSLLLQNLHCSMLEDAVWLVQLYQVLNPDAKCARVKCEPGQEVDFVQAYVNEDSSNKESLNQALQGYSNVSERA